MMDRGTVARVETELVREMDHLWRPVEGPLFSGEEMKALIGAGSVAVVGRARAGVVEVANMRAQNEHESVDEIARAKIRGGAAQLVTRMRVFLERTWCAVAGRAGTGIS